MNQTFAAWLLDLGKGAAISLVLMPLVFMAIFAVIRRFPRGWWLWGTGLMVLFTALGSLLFPVFLAPMFNSYTELPAGPLRDRIVAMAAANHIPAQHIYVSDASRQSKRISANVSGLGPTIRITLNDNLLHRTSPDEVVAVLGHEMGHYVLGHVWRLIALFALVFAVIFFVVSRTAPWLIARFPSWRVASVADPAAAPVLMLLASVAGVILTPIQNTITRTTEAQADAFGLDAARQPDAFAAGRHPPVRISQAGAGADRGVLLLRPSVRLQPRPSVDGVEARPRTRRDDGAAGAAAELTAAARCRTCSSSGSAMPPAMSSRRCRPAGRSPRRAATGMVGTLPFADEQRVRPLLVGASHVLVSIPPVGEQDIVLARYGDALPAGAWLGYLSSTGVYGDARGAWVDESAPITGSAVPGAMPPTRRGWGAARGCFACPASTAPAARRSTGSATARRIAPASPIRCSAASMSSDLAAGVIAGFDAPPGAYNLADDLPASQDDVVAYAADLLGLPPPPLVALTSSARPPARFMPRTVGSRTARRRRVLGWRPRYATYRLGLRDLSATTSPTAVSAAPTPASSVQR